MGGKESNNLQGTYTSFAWAWLPSSGTGWRWQCSSREIRDIWTRAIHRADMRNLRSQWKAGLLLRLEIGLEGVVTVSRGIYLSPGEVGVARGEPRSRLPIKLSLAFCIMHNA